MTRREVVAGLRAFEAARRRAREGPRAGRRPPARGQSTSSAPSAGVVAALRATLAPPEAWFGDMRLNAYVLAGDPAWIPESIGSYYGLVDRIVVSYDRAGRSWSGAPLSVAGVPRAHPVAADPDGKVVMLPGDHADPDRDSRCVSRPSSGRPRSTPPPRGRTGLSSSTPTRSFRTPACSRASSLALAISAGRGARVPRTGPLRPWAERVFLEQCGRFWGSQAAYPGPVAVRAGTTLSFARQAASAPLYRVDMAPWNTDPAHPRWAPVHAVVHPRDAVLHMSWVRTEAQMAEKSIVSGHASHRDWARELRTWRSRARHPLRTAARRTVHARSGAAIPDDSRPTCPSTPDVEP